MIHRRLRMGERDYQCVRVGELWHLTQEQASPPVVHRLGAWTSCCLWGEFRVGYERRRPTCPECLKHTERDEAVTSASSVPNRSRG